MVQESRVTRFAPWRVLLMGVAGIILIIFADRYGSLHPGLNAEYMSTPDRVAPRAISRRDSDISTPAILEAWGADPPAAFSVTWTGALLVLTPAQYTIRASASGDSEIVIDGQTILQTKGGVDSVVAATLTLDKGTHTLFAQYHRGGDIRFDVSWSRKGAQPQPIPGWALWTHKARRLSDLVLPAMLAISLDVVVLALSVWIVLVATRIGGATPVNALKQERLWPGLAWVAIASCVLNVAGLWWGLPGTWVAIETLPIYVLDAEKLWFSHGWYDAYPPLHYYVLALVSAPILFLRSHGSILVSRFNEVAVLLVLYRLVSVAAALGTVLATGMAAALAFGRRAGYFSAAAVALVAPFVFYAKTANVDAPYLFWFATSLVFYVRLLQRPTNSDYVWFGICTACAISTKDQAFALYLAAPFLIVIARWRTTRLEDRTRSIWLVALDRPVVLGGLAAVLTALVIDNVLFNASGFLMHVKSATSAANVYRVFEPTLAGRIALLRMSVLLTAESMGWPLFAAGAAGVVVAFTTARRRLVALALTLLVVTYYLAVINVVLYNYDRFMLPVCLVLAMFAGVAFDALLQYRALPSRWRTGVTTAVLAYSLLYAATVNVLMIRDSRYVVEDWLAAHASDNDVIGVDDLHEYLPRIDGYRVADLRTSDDLESARPRFVIINEDYGRTLPPDSPPGQLERRLADPKSGYQRVFRYRRPSPWPWLPGGHPDLVGTREQTTVFSILRDINPTIDVFERTESSTLDGKPSGV